MDLYFSLYIFLAVPTIYVDELFVSSDLEAVHNSICITLSNEILFRDIDDTEGDVI